METQTQKNQSLSGFKIFIYLDFIFAGMSFVSFIVLFIWGLWLRLSNKGYNYFIDPAAILIYFSLVSLGLGIFLVLLGLFLLFIKHLIQIQENQLNQPPKSIKILRTLFFAFAIIYLLPFFIYTVIFLFVPHLNFSHFLYGLDKIFLFSGLHNLFKGILFLIIAYLLFKSNKQAYDLLIILNAGYIFLFLLFTIFAISGVGYSDDIFFQPFFLIFFGVILSSEINQIITLSSTSFIGFKLIFLFIIHSLLILLIHIFTIYFLLKDKVKSYYYIKKQQFLNINKNTNQEVLK